MTCHASWKSGFADLGEFVIDQVEGEEIVYRFSSFAIPTVNEGAISDDGDGETGSRRETRAGGFEESDRVGFGVELVELVEAVSSVAVTADPVDFLGVRKPAMSPSWRGNVSLWLKTRELAQGGKSREGVAVTT